MKTVLRYMKPYAAPAVFCLLIKGLASFCELFIPDILAMIIDVAVPTGEVSGILRYGGYMLIFAALTFLFNVIGNRTAAGVAGKFSRDLRHALFEKTLALDTGDVDRIGTPSLISRITTDSYTVTATIARIARLGIRVPLLLIGGIVLTLFIEWRLALVMIAVLPPVCFVVYIISAKSVPIYQHQQQILDGLVRKVDETCSGIRVIKALSKEELEKKRFAEISGEVSHEEIRAGRLMSATKPTTDLLLNLGLCGVIVVGAVLAAREGNAMTGKLLAFMTYFTIILNQMIMMTRIFVQTSRSIASARRIEEVLLSESHLPTQEREKRENEPYLVFDHVSFSYHGVTPDLSDISFSLCEGGTLGVIGATGSGKSTLIKLLLRLYDPDEGSIRIDGEDIRSIPKKDLYARFGVAFQQGFVPAGTVLENVRFFRKAEETEVLRALETAQAEYVSSLEGGLSHAVTGRATNLSGGQRQRLTVARAVLGNPDILVLDDTSSALDYRTEAALRRALRKEKHKATVIVAQRVSAIAHADLILVLGDGKILGAGTHDELMKNLPAYRDIARVQMGGEPA